MKIPFLFSLAILPSFLLGQTTKKFYDEYRKDSVVLFYSEGTGVAFRHVKSSSGEITNTLILCMSVQNINPEDALYSGANVIFDDGSFITIDDKISLNFLPAGQSQMYTEHKLSEAEVKMLKEKKINFYIVGKRKNKIEKYQKITLSEAFSDNM